MSFKVVDSQEERTYIVQDSSFGRMKKLEDEINEFIKNDHRDLIIDLVHLSKIDSMSLAAIIRIKNSLNEDDRNLRLINISEDILMVIDLAGLDSLL